MEYRKEVYFEIQGVKIQRRKDQLEISFLILFLTLALASNIQLQACAALNRPFPSFDPFSISG